MQRRAFPAGRAAARFEPHYDRHVWLYRDNPSGVFAPFNPAVTCEHHTGPRAYPTAHAMQADATSDTQEDPQ